MTKDTSFGHLTDFARITRPPQQRLCHIALLGDFSGRENRGLRRSSDELANQKPLLIDRDNVDQRLRSLNVRLDSLLVAPDRAPVSLEFHELDDFDPDSLYRRIDLFADLRDLRKRLEKPETFNSARQELAELFGETELTPGEANESKVVGESLEPARIDSGKVLDQILEEYSTDNRIAAERAEFDWSRLRREVVKPHVVPGPDPRTGELVQSLDNSVSLIMAALMHHPGFRGLEALWRSVDFLVRRVETNENLKLFLIDISREELAADLMGQDDLSGTGFYRLMVESTVETAGGQPWSLMMGNYYFGAGVEDSVLLGRLAKISAAARAPFVTGSDGSVFGCRDPGQRTDHSQWNASFSDTWQLLRNLPEADYLTMLWPRFMIRLPYGHRTRPTQYFDFEEVTQSTEKHLLWGHPAVLVVAAIANCLMDAGWTKARKQSYQIADLPFWVQTSDGETVAHPCTELLLSERAVAAVQASGIVPIVAFKEQDKVLLPQLDSVYSGSTS